MAEHDVTKLMSVKEAMEVIDRTEVRPRTVRVPLGEADGMRLAADVLADRDYPPFVKSLMDGYAVRCADIVGRGAGTVELRVVGELAAGTSPQRPLGPGEAVSIMTGAPVPAGADGVVPVEDIERRGDGSTVRILRPGQPNRYLAVKGSDCIRGTVVLKRGAAIGPQQVAVLATVGAAEVDVMDRPNVAVLSTGDELADVADAAPGAAQIRNSNGPMLVALLKRMGCRVSDLGQCRDDPDALRAKLADGMRHDALFVTGGMSMGEYDFVPRLLQELSVELKITKLRIKPGKPFVFGTRKRSEVRGQSSGHGGPPSAGGLNSELQTLNSDSPSFVFGLPGNPVSAFVCTVRLASRLLERMAGGEVRENWQTGRLEVGMVPNGPREFYQPVIRTVAQGRNSAQAVLAGIRPLTWKGSADLFTLAAANALLVRAENEPPLPMGTVVKVLEI